MSPIERSAGGGGGGGGTVTNVSSADSSIVVTNPNTTPSLQLAHLNTIATNEPPTADWSNASHKITNLANGSAASDAAAFGQIQIPQEPYFKGVVATFHPWIGSTVGTYAINALIAHRIVIGTTGTLHDVSVYVSTASGNIAAAIYDTASPRNRLWTSGSIATPAAGAWKIIGDPNLAVTVGDQYDLCIATDNATTSLFRQSMIAASNKLPANFMPGAGGSPFTVYQVATSFPPPATLAEASFATVVNPVCIIARIA